MTVQYQINGDIFSEITTTWLCAYSRDFLIKARQHDTDQAGNTIEIIQLSDGRIFTRATSNPQDVNIPEDNNLCQQNTQSTMYERSPVAPSR